MKPVALLSFIAIGIGLAVLYACQDIPEVTQQSPAFAVVSHRLTVSGTGTGSGMVTSKPAGIKCTITAGTAGAAGCSALFAQGVTVILTAKPAATHSFAGWGAPCSGVGTCKIAMTSARTVSARFLKGPFTITIASGTSGSGSGRVTSQTGLVPAINCLITDGAPSLTGCSGSYPANKVVMLAATPAAGFALTGWGEPSCGTGTCQIAAIQNQTIPVTFSRETPSAPAVEGRWHTPFSTPVVAVHLHVLTTGKVLLWGDKGDAYLWDLASGFTPAGKGYRVYCSGHTFLPDGRLLVTGGTSPQTRGLRAATVFDPLTMSWGGISSMAQGRYYPTVTTLPSGEILVVSGHDTALSVVAIPEVRHAGGWRRLNTAPLAIPDPYYPAMFVAPNGKVFLAGFPQTTRYLDVEGTGRWTTVADRKVADRRLGSAVMYAPGKILYAGGGRPPVSSAEVIDLNQAPASWRTVSPMAFPRRHMNATILADGSVLVTGGTAGLGFNNQAGAVHSAELWSPATETWKTMAPEARNRTYHSTALLLPTGQLLSAGSGEGGGIPYANSEFSAQIFSPPYLFTAGGSQATRPVITSAPTRLSYGQPFTVETPDPGSIARGTLIRLSSVTHSFNMSQLIYHLSFTATGATSLGGVAPLNASLAPPGPYMLFLINGSGVPSVARIVMVGT